MAWYTLLLLASSVFFIGQFVLSFFFGDSELDADIDSDLDADLYGLSTSDIISFKGILHFIIGFSLTLTLFGGVNLVSLLIALLVGVSFTILLALLYRFIYSLEQHQTYPDDKFENYHAEVIYFKQSNLSGECALTLNGKWTTLPLISDIPLKYGDKIIVSGTKNFAKFVSYID